MIQSVQTKHGEMKYVRFGNPEGPSFVILPGLSLTGVTGAGEAIAAAYAELAEDYDMILFDRITEFPAGYDLFTMADDAYEALELAGIEHPVLMGVSQGGMLAQLIAVNHPEAVSALILCSTVPSMKGVDPAAFDEWQRLAEARDAAGLAESFGRYVYTPEFFEQYKEPILAQGQGVTELDFRNFLISLAATRDFDVSDRLGAVTCPSFVLGAGEDRVLGVRGSYDLMELLGCEGYIYEGKGHGVYDEAPDYRSRIKTFLAAH